MFDDEGFNFWPSFADAMLAIVLLLVVVMALVVAQARVNIEGIRDEQDALTRQMVDAYGGNIDTVSSSSGSAHFVITKEGEKKVAIHYDLQQQRITFQGNILFDVNEHRLEQRGRRVLSRIGPLIAERVDEIQRILIEGHTDIEPTERYAAGNLELGALRAISVYQFLVDSMEVDPARQVIAVTSFGRYMPVQREVGESYSRKKLWNHNRTESLKARNRRIELRLFYKK